MRRAGPFLAQLRLPMGRSHYAALKLPASRKSCGLRVRSSANRQVVYPSLLFLDEAKRPTRLLSDAVYQLHPENWHLYAFIEGTVQVSAECGERYVLLITTNEDSSLQTLDKKPFKRPLQALAVDEAIVQRQGAFEPAICDREAGMHRDRAGRTDPVTMLQRQSSLLTM